MLLQKARQLAPWDAEPADNLSINDLDQKEIINTLDESIKRGRTKAELASDDPKTALRILGLLKEDVPVHAAGVLFCKDAQSQCPQCLLRLVRFKGVTKSNILDSRQIYGNAFLQLTEAENFLMRHMSISSEFVPGKMARIDHPEYSLRAVREAMVNAICHRDYSIQNGSISFMMYDDRLEITSHGNLPQGISLNDLKKTHDSFPRNAKITHVMYKRGIIESVGTGTQEMLAECRAINAPEPEYMERGTTFVVQLLANPKTQHTDILTARQREILTIITARGSCTTTNILESMKAPPTDRTLRNDLSLLEKLGYVARQGKGRSTTWRLPKS